MDGPNSIAIFHVKILSSGPYSNLQNQLQKKIRHTILGRIQF